MMISMDDPGHQQRRSLVYRGFTPKRVQDHSDRIVELCTMIIDKVCEQGECDFVWDIAAPLPLLLIADMLGFPPEAYDDLLKWSDDMMRGTTGYPNPGGPVTEAQMLAHEAGMAFREFQLGVIADRRSKPPQDDLVSTLCYAEIDGIKLDDESIVQESLLILIGGDETSRHVITDRHARPARLPRPARPPRRRPGADRDRRRGAAPLGLPHQEHGPHRHPRRRDAGPAAARGRPGHALLPVGQPRRVGVRPTRTGSTSPATRTRTWRSGSARTSASARRSPASSSR